MAQYIAEDPVHVVVRSERAPVHDAKGNLLHERRRRLYAKFERGQAPPWAYTTAKELGFEFRTCPEDFPEAQWLAFYDSVYDMGRMGWDDEERKAIEAKLDAQGYIKVSRPKIEPPYANYVKLTTAQGRRTVELCAQEAVKAVAELGFPADVIVTFERENPRKESAAIIAAVEALTPVEPVEELVEA